MENNNKSKWFKEEVKFIIIIIAFVASALFNWFSTKSDISLIKYRVDKIEQARAEVWLKQEELNKTQTAFLQQMNTNLEILLSAYRKNGIIK